MLSSPAAQPLFIECPSCSGTGTQTEYRGPWSRDYRCEDCDGTGIALCETRRCGAPAIRVVADMRCCSACAVLADADFAAYAASLCKAGQDHDYLRHHATEQEWAALEYVGIQSDDVETIELRNCACHSTLCRVVARVTEIQDGVGNVTYSAPIAAGAVR